VTDRNPGIYIPTLYIAEGLPYTIVMMMSGVFYKSMGASNEFIGLTSLLYIPWTVKLFWAPLVDLLSERRTWILGSQVVLAVLIAMLALGALTAHAVFVSLWLLALIALASATQDVAIDGFYLEVLSKEQQAFYVGVRNAAYKIAWLFGSGALVYLAGKIGETASIFIGWSAAFAVCAALFALAAVFHRWYLPRNVNADQSEPGYRLSASVFRTVFATYFKQPGIFAIVFYILTFRLGDALMLKMAQPFLLDSQSRGGLGCSTADVGIVYGTVGTIFLLAGGILGGWLVARDGLRRWLLPTAIAQNSAILLYWALAMFKPGLGWVAAANSVEQFSYGLGVAAYTVFLLGTVRPEFRAAHYATATALMALGVMLPGSVSGYLQASLGYTSFFLVSFLASLPGLVSIFFLPIAARE